MSVSDKDHAGELLIQEVDEELRREQYHRLWKRYGNYVIGVAVAIVFIVAGYQGWQSWQNKQRQQEAAQFAAAQELIAQDKTRVAIEMLAKLGTESHTGFAIAARMRRAELLASQGDTAQAAASYEEIAASSAPQVYRDLAVLKGALLTLDQADPAQVEKRVAPLVEAGNPWHYTAAEVLAMVAQKKGDTKRAADLYKQLADDLQAPQGVRARAAEMLTVLNPTGGATSPEPAKPASDKAKG